MNTTMLAKDYLSLLLQLISLAAIIYSAIKIINRNIQEWALRESRTLDIEKRLGEIDKELTAMHGMGRDIATILVKQTDLCMEVERMRGRLDRFLDAPNVRAL